MTDHITPAGTPDGLAEATACRVSKAFARANHRPSEEMTEGLRDMARQLEDQANGTALPKLFLSSLDPGVGKTTTIRCFAEALAGSPLHGSVGMLICVSSLSEAKSLADELREVVGLGVYTTDPETNALASEVAGAAQVLIVTHQMLINRTERGTFEGAKEFYFQGAPRTVKVWDEAFLPGMPIKLSTGDIELMASEFHLGAPKSAAALKQMVGVIEGTPSKGTAQFIDVASETGLSVDGARAIIKQQHGVITPKHERILSNLWRLSGHRVAVRKRNDIGGQVVLCYQDWLPDGLLPLLVTDASGRVRETYPEMSRGRGNLVELAAARKSYRNLTVHHWKRGGGRSSVLGNEEEIAESVASLIRSRPQEEWLVVLFKPKADMDFEKRLSDRLEVELTRCVHYLTWGRHRSTNQFKSVPNVVLVGTLFYDDSTYEATARAAAGEPPDHRPFDDHRLDAMRRGETGDIIVQAVSRASVRQCDDDACKPCQAYVILDKRHCRDGFWENLFPDCEVVEWCPVPRPLPKSVQKALAVLDGFIQQGRSHIPFKDVYEALGMTSSNFTRLVRKHAGFREQLAERLVSEEGHGQRKSWFDVAFLDHGEDGAMAAG